MNLIITVALIASCFCGVVPERQNDFVWENDKFGMRAYGPGESHRWSGLDVFNKDARQGCTCYEVLKDHDHCGDWHTTPWRGILDNYTVGAGRGLGAVAIFGDGEWKTYPDWIASRIITNTADVCEFELTYAPCSILGVMTYHITLKRGERFFKNTVTFSGNIRPGFLVGPGIDIAPNRGHDGDLWVDGKLGIISLFERDKGGEEGVTMSAIFLDPGDSHDFELKTDHLGCRILSLKRSTFTYYAGASWSRAEEITTPAQWHEEVRKFRCLKAE